MRCLRIIICPAIIIISTWSHGEEIECSGKGVQIARNLKYSGTVELHLRGSWNLLWVSADDTGNYGGIGHTKDGNYK